MLHLFAPIVITRGADATIHGGGDAAEGGLATATIVSVR